MKKILMLILICMFSGAVIGQGRGNAPIDTLYSVFELGEGDLDEVVKKLPQYEAESCLFSLLDEIVKNDASCSGEIGYYFSCVKVDEKILIKISPVNLGKISYGQYFGYFIYSGRSFLCYGDIRCYVSKAPISNPLVLKSFTANYPQVSGLYLGGDTNGVLKVFNCKDRQQYALVKTCVSQAEQKLRRKERRY